MTCAEVVDHESGALLKLPYGCNMSLGEIYHMDIVSYSCTVRSVVIISENMDSITLADGNLCDIRYKIVWDALWILTDKSRRMCSDRIEVSEQDNVEVRLCLIDIDKYILDHALGGSVRIGCFALREILGDRHLIRLSVYSRGG